ncbi:MAG: hypothetical protein IT576_04100 [Verrucomicrobiales bacterium]|nr:hypothetical protein [Verrucomicrobiales bacterium]
MNTLTYLTFPMAVILGLASIFPGPAARADETPPTALVAAMSDALKKEFGRAIETEAVYERKIAVVKAYAFKFKLKATEIDKSWADKFVRALKVAGVAAEITVTNDTGPADVRAADFTVGKFTIQTLQLVGRPGEEDVVVSLSVLIR